MNVLKQISEINLEGNIDKIVFNPKNRHLILTSGKEEKEISFNGGLTNENSTIWFSIELDEDQIKRFDASVEN